jgi:hypothetical protein
MANHPGYVYDAQTHTAATPCPQKWFWCRIHWWTRFGGNGEKWYEPYPLTVNRKDCDGTWINTQVYCGPGTYYPKPPYNRSYRT